MNTKPQANSDLLARRAALVLLQSVLHKSRSIDDSFDAAARGLEPRDRAFVRMLAATTLRRLGQIDDVLSRFVAKEPPDAVKDLLRLGAAQLLFLGTPPHAAVGTTVALVKEKIERLGGLANAVMRKVADQGAALVSAQDAAQLDTPAWLWDSWVAAYGAPAAQATAEAHLGEPPLDITLKNPSETAIWAEKLAATPLPTGSLRITRSGRVQELTGFAEGAWWVQDAAATLPAKILLQALGSGSQRVCDVCAAPGGKTAQLAAAGHTVTALDVSAPRMGILIENLKRLNLTAQTVTADAATWRPDSPFDGLLLDAPCSATGTIRRHPDLPFLKRPSDLAGFVAQQTRLLKASAAMVRPGGFIVYSVCSLQPEERKDVVDAVLAEDANLTRLKIPAAAVAGESQFLTPQGELRTLPSQWPELGGLDGFYGVLLQRLA